MEKPFDVLTLCPHLSLRDEKILLTGVDERESKKDAQADNEQ